jgi:hypothetical protein
MGGESLGNLGVDGKIILKQVLEIIDLHFSQMAQSRICERRGIH